MQQLELVLSVLLYQIQLFVEFHSSVQRIAPCFATKATQLDMSLRPKKKIPFFANTGAAKIQPNITFEDGFWMKITYKIIMLEAKHYIVKNTLMMNLDMNNFEKK